jgi:hypothetical protein
MFEDITLAVTTYNRAATLDRWLHFHEPLGCQILVVNNGSTDDTLAVAKRHNVPVVTNKDSRGFWDGWSSLFDYCGTSSLLIVSDEDNVVSVPSAEMNQAAFISSRFEHPRFTRGNGSGQIKINELLVSSFYISGLLYDAEKGRVAVDFFRDCADNFFWQTYPQCAMLIVLLSEESAFWLDEVVCRQREELPMLPPTDGSAAYNSLEGRRKLFADWHRLLDYALEKKPAMKNTFESMRSQRVIDDWGRM